MRYERVKKFPSWSPTSNSKTSKSLDESRPFPLQAKPHSDLPPTQEDIENEAFQQHKHEATGLEVQAEYGTLPPEGQQRLTVLQAKMADFWQRKESQERSGINLLEIPNLFAPRQPLAAQPIQAKLTIGEPGDKYEQEADQVAARVVNQINSPQTKPSSQGGTVQRDEIAEDEEKLNKKPLSDSIQREELPEEDEEVKMKPLFDSIQREELPEEDEEVKMKPLSDSIQREELPEEDEEVKMKPLSDSIQREELPEEDEEVKMKPLSDSIQRQELPQEDEEVKMKPLSDSIQRQELPQEDEEVKMKPLSDSIQRQELPQEDEEVQRKPLVQRSSAAGGMAATPDLEASIQQARGSGQPLADSVRKPMEQAFGADFSGVNVHTDTQSDQLNQSIQAKAFTTGKDIFFRQGEYDPGSRGGQELIAHELTHVVQQN